MTKNFPKPLKNTFLHFLEGIKGIDKKNNFFDDTLERPNWNFFEKSKHKPLLKQNIA